MAGRRSGRSRTRWSPADRVTKTDAKRVGASVCRYATRTTTLPEALPVGLKRCCEPVVPTHYRKNGERRVGFPAGRNDGSEDDCFVCPTYAVAAGTCPRLSEGRRS